MPVAPRLFTRLANYSRKLVPPWNTRRTAARDVEIVMQEPLDMLEPIPRLIDYDLFPIREGFLERV